jgi:hypothetical protein
MTGSRDGQSGMDLEAGRRRSKATVIVVVNLLVAGLHFVIGRNYQGPFPKIVNGYLIDLVLPLALYILICTQDRPPLGIWWVRALLVFGIGCFVEAAQFLGYPLFGSTFDPWDILMYGLGVTAGVVLDILVFPKVFSFWKPVPSNERPPSA